MLNERMLDKVELGKLRKLLGNPIRVILNEHMLEVIHLDQGQEEKIFKIFQSIEDQYFAGDYFISDDFGELRGNEDIPVLKHLKRWVDGYNLLQMQRINNEQK